MELFFNMLKHVYYIRPQFIRGPSIRGLWSKEIMRLNSLWYGVTSSRDYPAYENRYLGSSSPD